MTRVIVAGAVANKPGNSGEAWVRANWVRGLGRLGVEAWFVEQLDPARWGDDTASCVAWFDRIVRLFGLAERSVLIDGRHRVLVGSPAAVAEVRAGADLLVNISGHLGPGPITSGCRRRAFVDLDPGYTQIWHAQGADLGVAAHDVHFTVGLNLGGPDCTVPTDGVRWRPVLPPVVLDDWEPGPGESLDRFTTVASWRGASGVVHHDGVDFGPKAHEFRRLLELPTRVPAGVELALEIHPADRSDRDALVDHGWSLVEPADVVGDPEAYRRYVRESSAELSVAQPVYVHTRTGWFSDRTAHYLAAGRPVLVQDTGGPLPDGDGLLRFRTLEDAATAARDLIARYLEHRVAARRFAEDRLDAERVLARVLDQCGLGER